MKNYHDNVEGMNSRTKVRIRWYGPLKGECSKPVLEIKRKEGSLSQKQAYPLKSFVFDDALTHEKLNRALHTSELPDAVRSSLSPLVPVMVNRYSRNYFQSSNRKFRLTLDSSQHYFRFNKLKNRFGRGIENKEELVLELKYAYEDDKQAMLVSSIIPFRISKNSKYINGINQLYRA